MKRRLVSPTNFVQNTEHKRNCLLFSLSLLFVSFLTVSQIHITEKDTHGHILHVGTKERKNTHKNKLTKKVKSNPFQKLRNKKNIFSMSHQPCLSTCLTTSSVSSFHKNNKTCVYILEMMMTVIIIMIHNKKWYFLKVSLSSSLIFLPLTALYALTSESPDAFITLSLCLSFTRNR